MLGLRTLDSRSSKLFFCLHIEFSVLVPLYSSCTKKKKKKVIVSTTDFILGNISNSVKDKESNRKTGSQGKKNRRSYRGTTSSWLPGVGYSLLERDALDMVFLCVFFFLFFFSTTWLSINNQFQLVQNHQIKCE